MFPIRDMWQLTELPGIFAIKTGAMKQPMLTSMFVIPIRVPVMKETSVRISHHSHMINSKNERRVLLIDKNTCYQCKGSPA